MNSKHLTEPAETGHDEAALVSTHTMYEPPHGLQGKEILLRLINREICLVKHTGTPGFLNFISPHKIQSLVSIFKAVLGKETPARNS